MNEKPPTSAVLRFCPYCGDRIKPGEIIVGGYHFACFHAQAIKCQDQVKEAESE